MSRKKKVILSLIILVLLILTGAVIWAANELVEFAVGRDSGTIYVAPPSVVSDQDGRTMSTHYEIQQMKIAKWTKSVTREQVTSRAGDGLKLNGEYALNSTDLHRWVIAVHGYRGNHQHMLGLGSYYGMQGYHVLMPDLRGCGESEGNYLTMGWQDRKDMLAWIDWIVSRDPEASIVLHGISMGGATVLMTSGEELPSQVKAIVSDCGYTSVWDIFEDELKYLFHLPAFPVLYVGDIVAEVKTGYRFSEASALRQVKNAKVPMLFIHGEKDNFVSTDMVYPLYEACPTEKQILVVQGAGHGSSCYMDPELYYGTVFTFLREYMPE